MNNLVGDRLERITLGGERERTKWLFNLYANLVDAQKQVGYEEGGRHA